MLREGNRLQVFADGVLRRMFWLEREKVGRLHKIVKWDTS
jgi:hypothetical protein